MHSSKIDFSVVIPVYNSENTLEELAQRISTVFAGLNSSFEIIMIDDGSRDSSWNVLMRIREVNRDVEIIRLIRNFGQHNATLCGFRHAQGRYVIVMDDDLQNPPEEIPKLIKKIEQGYAVVYGAYEEKKHGFVENVLSKAFQRLIHYILHIPSSTMISSFVICKREVIQNAVTTRTAFPFLTALITRNTPIDKITNASVKHVERKIGKSNYNILRWLKVSFSLIINYSSLPLEIVAAVGIIASCASVLFGLYIVIARILNPSYGVIGWNSLMVATALLGGLILTAMSVVGEYLRRIIAEISYEQQYIIADEDMGA
jgi:polyisoprenyl-phosphate glycosyltransferase